MTTDPVANSESTEDRLPSATSEGSAPPRRLNSADLFKGDREIHIQHEEKIYRLQVTRNGKLILTK